MSLDKGSVGKTNFIEEHGLWSEDMKRQSLELIKQVKKEDLQTIRVAWGDQHGIVRGKNVMARDFIQSLDNGIDFQTATLFFDTTNNMFAPMFEPDAGIGMPEVGIFPSDAPNAFATGWNRNNALVAVSSGMLRRFKPEEVRAVMAHEIGHVANGDMITLSLIQGVVNTFVMFFARVIGHTVDRVVFKNERGLGIGYLIGTIVAEILLSILASMIVMWFSRYREYRADAAGADLAGKAHMTAALRRLQSEMNTPSDLPGELTAFGIRPGGSKFGQLFSSHPPLDKRIEALQNR